MAKYRKRPVVVEATRWFKNGDHPQDVAQIAQRSARSSDDQQAAQALLDELAHIEVVAEVAKEAEAPKTASQVVGSIGAIGHQDLTKVAEPPVETKAAEKPKGETKKGK